MARMRALPLSAFLLLMTARVGAATLEIYFVDVEGGQATLVVSPSGESLLVDAGWAGNNTRDAERILAAARAAGVQRIDYLVATHYHGDHVGGIPALAERIPVAHFVDHGPTVERSPRALDLEETYRKVRDQGVHIQVRPGDRLPIAGLEVVVLASAGNVIAEPAGGQWMENSYCQDDPKEPLRGGENPQSVGLLIRYGDFRLLNLGDLTADREFQLACPRNRIGSVDVYLSTHHGGSDSGISAVVHGVQPRAAIINNGARKGGLPEIWSIVRASPRLEDIWQLHFSIQAGKEHNAPEDYIANLDEQCQGHALRLSAGADGTFAITNTRTGFSKTYAAR
jgi:beta-lactamase superfamily II metal-dependent hydrolase